MSTVLACIDDSPAAGPVLRAARAIAPLFGAEVEGAHVDEQDDATASAAARFQDVSLQTLRGDVVESLESVARHEHVAAVTIGARDHTRGQHPAGHVAWELANRIDAPVLVVPPESEVPDRVTRVLIAMKGTPASAKSLKRAVELAAGAEIELVVLHVDDENSIPSFSDQVQYDAEEYTREFLARYVPGAPDARLELRIGAPAEEILCAAESIRPQVIAVGFRQGHDAGEDDVVPEILQRSHLPVLLVPIL
jgi:nucleotide-binding universal stress UspA family protein